MSDTGILLSSFIDADYRYQFVNIAYARYFGVDREQIVGRRVRDVTGEANFKIAKPNIDRAYAGEIVYADIESSCRDKECNYVRARYIPVRDQEENILGVAVLAYDCTAQRLLEREMAEQEATLARSEARLRAVFETVTDPIVVFNTRGIVESCTPAITDLLGYSPDEVMGQKVSMLMSETDGNTHDRYLANYLRSGAKPIVSSSREVSGQAKSGALIPLLLKISETYLEETTLFVGVLRDMRPEKRAQEAVHSRAELVDQMSEAVIATDLTYRINSWNKAAERMYGYRADEVVGESIALLHCNPGGSLAAAAAMLMAKGSWRGEVHQLRRDGSEICVFSSTAVLTDPAGKPYGVVAINRDITEIKRLESELALAQKLEAVGTLASGVAHDFNNMLMGIIGCASLASEKLSPESEARTYIDELKRSAIAGREIVSELMDFGRHGQSSMEGEPALVDLVVGRLGPIAASLVTESIALEIELHAPAVHVACGDGKLTQILMNLVANAKHAMPSGGRLSVRTDVTRVEEDDHRSAAGQYVALAISDTGIGMDEQTRSRVFEPFFTTRPAEQGTGLGLSNVYAIVKRIGGHVSINSAPGEGTTVTILLPTAKMGRAAKGTEHPPTIGATRQRNTVLVVEDDPLVRMTVEHYLRSGRFEVHVASSAAGALALIEKHGRTIDLLLTDVVMPTTSGPELAREVRRRGMDLPVLFMSAHSRSSLLETGTIGESDPTLHKPFVERDLLMAVQQILVQPSEATIAGVALSGTL